MNLPSSYGFASGLIGFRSSTLRVRLLDHRDGCVWVVTADLLDAGTRLVLDEGQFKAEAPVEVLRHKEGLVSFGS